MKRLKLSYPIPSASEMREAVDIGNRVLGLTVRLKDGTSISEGYLEDSGSGGFTISLDVPKAPSNGQVIGLSYSPTLDVNFLEMDGGIYYMHLTGGITLTMSNFAAGRRVTLLFTASSTYAISEPAGLNPTIKYSASGSLEHDTTASTVRNIRLDYLCAGETIGTVFTGPIH